MQAGTRDALSFIGQFLGIAIVSSATMIVAVVFGFDSSSPISNWLALASLLSELISAMLAVVVIVLTTVMVDQPGGREFCREHLTRPAMLSYSGLGVGGLLFFFAVASRIASTAAQLIVICVPVVFVFATVVVLSIQVYHWRPAANAKQD